MIEYIKGQLAELTPALAVVEAAGVGYALNISLTTYSGIQGKKEVKLYVHEALTTGGRDDSFTLFAHKIKKIKIKNSWAWWVSLISFEEGGQFV